ncbi:hypothetical protein FJ364_03200 [Candidatus Dependentiae bacterium]|nr:hypothetical protein [Candidatus Dependentiae bacterium]
MKLVALLYLLSLINDNFDNSVQILETNEELVATAVRISANELSCSRGIPFCRILNKEIKIDDLEILPEYKSLFPNGVVITK